jgi:hypothetical protein
MGTSRHADPACRRRHKGKGTYEVMGPTRPSPLLLRAANWMEQNWNGSTNSRDDQFGQPATRTEVQLEPLEVG